MIHTVRLTPGECRVAAFVGVLRQTDAVLGGRKHVSGGEERIIDPEWTHVQGVAAELAVAKLTNRFPRFNLPLVAGTPDVGHSIEVRRNTRTSGRLVIRPNDPEDRIYVLVRGEYPLFDVVGWIRGADGKREEWLDNPYNNWPAYFIPAEALTPFPDSYAYGGQHERFTHPPREAEEAAS